MIPDNIKNYLQPFEDVINWLGAMSKQQKRELLLVLSNNRIDLLEQKWTDEQLEQVMVSHIVGIVWDNETYNLIRQTSRRLEFKCKSCGGTFQYKYLTSKPKYCNECRANRNIIRKTTTQCIKCGKVFERKDKKAYKKCEDCRKGQQQQ